MIRRWRRLGHVYAPKGEKPFLISHASVPFAEPLGGSLVRIWFSPRDALNRSHVASLVADFSDEKPRILSLDDAPVLGPGERGGFDDAGAMMSWIAGPPADRRLFYIGWTIRTSVPFHVAIGVAHARGDRWERQRAPLLDRGNDIPLFCSNPCVLYEDGTWQMWYLDGLGWNEAPDGRLSASYNVCRATSQNGTQWADLGRVAIPLEADEYAIARPSVRATPDGYAMWFCARTLRAPYRIGAARSRDGLHWTRAPELAVIAGQPEAWESDMSAYPHVFECNGKTWMLYCGNGFGRSGFGLAVLD